MGLEWGCRKLKALVLEKLCIITRVGVGIKILGLGFRV